MQRSGDDIRRNMGRAFAVEWCREGGAAGRTIPGLWACGVGRGACSVGCRAWAPVWMRRACSVGCRACGVGCRTQCV